MNHLTEGQRYISEMEPELGLGTLTDIESRRVLIDFYGSGCQRKYSIENAPLKRVVFKVGDAIETRNKLKIIIDHVQLKDGLLYYREKSCVIPETDILDTISFSSPQDRLKSGFYDTNRLFELRYDLSQARYQYTKSDVMGFLGGRVEMIPHQFYIAHEITSRYIPRVLLSDEVGLGKTIEACLILHRLIISERIGRALIVVPESLVHQWFVELYRRFNLTFRIMNQNHCKLLEISDKNINPFMDDQLIICSYAFLESDKKRRIQAEQAGWDIILADEAHHMDETSSFYRFFENLTRNVNGLILITATPEQPGQKNHFSHLKLIDPVKYHHFETFSKEMIQFRKTAEKADGLIQKINNLNVNSKEKKVYQHELSDILDCFGPGRAIFRNTRSVIRGFPQRIPHIHEFFGRRSQVDQANLEFLSEYGADKNDTHYSLEGDLRVSFLKELIEKTGDDKILLICQSLQKSLKIEQALKQIINVKVAQFNETMSLIQRDRSAAWFSDKHGAKLMICSEIGSEGRNFQFSNHLVLFDLPENPELLEQRIGRLDRIGQTQDIHIHIPYIKGSTQEILVNWYHTGIDIFKTNVSGLHHIFNKFKQDLHNLIDYSLSGKGISYKRLDTCVRSTREFTRYISEELKHGRNRLLEMNSFKPDVASDLLAEIDIFNKFNRPDRLILELFDHFEIDQDEIDTRTYKLSLDQVSETDFPVPVLKKDGMIATFDREKAVVREDIDYLSWDHPMITGSMELFLGTEQGNCACAEIDTNGSPEILLEALFFLECVAPKGLYMNRFLPHTPIRIVINHALEDVTQTYSYDSLKDKIKKSDSDWISVFPELLGNLLPEMISVSETKAGYQAVKIKKSGLMKIEDVVGREIDRLKALNEMNSGVRVEEIKLAEKEMIQLRHHVEGSRIRLDSIRLIKAGS